MPDTVRTFAALQTLLADNTSGDISPQDIRDFLASVFNWVNSVAGGSTGTITFTGTGLTAQNAGNITMILQATAAGYAQLTITGNGNTANLRLKCGDAANSYIYFDDATNGVRGQIYYTPSTRSLHIQTNTADANSLIHIDSTGRMSLGNVTQTAKLDINSDILRLRTAKTPANAGAAGNAGDICWDANYLYICIATNTWRRIQHDTW